ncbi:unnamed protein product [Symbiodinium natans]|uniref:EF-hand domain-containing protein n=1 Tax=Symbiodinium natans TaxID=878477 RepID=A0A812V419_9DINO|nr:unnamed protein product [Symbiodinium natans]
MATDPGPGHGAGGCGSRERSRSPQGGKGTVEAFAGDAPEGAEAKIQVSACPAPANGTAGGPGVLPGGSVAPCSPCGPCMGQCPTGPCMVNPMLQMQQMQMMQMQQMQQMVGMGMMMGNMFNMMGTVPSVPGVPAVPGVPSVPSFDPMTLMGATPHAEEDEEATCYFSFPKESPIIFHCLAPALQEVDIPPGPSSTVGHPNYRPPDAEQTLASLELIPGITDKRFEGKIRLWWDSKGHGLIECEEVRLKFPGQDGVFLHDSQRRHFKKGDEITFAVPAISASAGWALSIPVSLSSLARKSPRTCLDLFELHVPQHVIMKILKVALIHVYNGADGSKLEVLRRAVARQPASFVFVGFTRALAGARLVKLQGVEFYAFTAPRDGIIQVAVWRRLGDVVAAGYRRPGESTPITVRAVGAGDSLSPGRIGARVGPLADLYQRKEFDRSALVYWESFWVPTSFAGAKNSAAKIWCGAPKAGVAEAQRHGPDAAQAAKTEDTGTALTKAEAFSEIYRRPLHRDVALHIVPHYMRDVVLGDINPQMGCRRDGKVSVYSKDLAAEAAPRDRASVLAGAQDALFSAPSAEVRQQDSLLEGDEDGSERWEENGGEYIEEDHPEEDPEDDEAVYLSEAYREWEVHYLRRLAMRIHRLLTLELDRAEEALFAVFVQHDANLDGRVRGDEATKLLQAIESCAPGSTEESTPQKKDGSISLVSLLRWYSGSNGSEQKASSYSFGAATLLTGLLGSGVVGCDARLQGLDWLSLRRNVMGYRRIYSQLRELKEERMLTLIMEKESQTGLLETMPEYYKLLAKEFEGDMELLFELFCEVDESNNLLLEEREVEIMLRKMDTVATPEELRRYVAEINLTDGPLSFQSLIDWWDQARTVPNSLVSEKGSALVASIKGRAYAATVAGLFGDTAVQRRWEQADAEGTLQALRQAYCRTWREVREYKAERDLRRAETECAQL